MGHQAQKCLLPKIIVSWERVLESKDNKKGYIKYWYIQINGYINNCCLAADPPGQGLPPDHDGAPETDENLREGILTAWL